MAYDGNGNYLRVSNWSADAAAGILIESSRHDTEGDDLAAALSNVICRDGQSTVTAPITFSGQRILNLGTPTVGTDAINARAVQDQLTTHIPTISGTADALVGSVPFALAHQQGSQFSFRAELANTGPATIDINGLGPKDLRKAGNLPLQPGDLQPNTVYHIMYTGLDTFTVLGLERTGSVTIATGSASGVAEVLFAGLTDDYARYNLTLTDVTPVNNGVSLFLRTGTSAVLEAGATAYRHSAIQSSIGQAVLQSGSNAADAIVAAVDLNNASGSGTEATLIIDVVAAMSNNEPTKAVFHGGYVDSGNRSAMISGWGARTALSQDTHFGLLSSNGNLFSADYTLTGVRK